MHAFVETAGAALRLNGLSDITWLEKGLRECSNKACLEIIIGLLGTPGLRVPNDERREGERKVSGVPRTLYTIFGESSVSRNWYKPDDGGSGEPSAAHDGPPTFGGADAGATAPTAEDGGATGRRTRFFIDDVAVTNAFERSQYLDANGRLITEDYRVFLKDEIKKTLRQQFLSLEAFLLRWNDAERKQAVIDELTQQGIPLQILTQAVPNGDELDVFDLVAHIAFNQKPLTRKERAEKVKKRNYFAKYGEQARIVLEALLEKYADHGIADIENSNILELPPFNALGTKTQIRRGIFGGNEKYSQALTELERALYERLTA